MSHCQIVSCLFALLLTTGSTQAQEWKPFTSKADGFKVLLPGTPQEGTKKSPWGTPLTHYMLLVDNGGYIVMANTIPDAKGLTEEKLQRALDASREAALKSCKGKLLREQKVRLAGKYPGLETEIALPDNQGVLLSRSYIVNGRMYHMIVGSQGSGIKSEDGRKFLDSFELVK